MANGGQSAGEAVGAIQTNRVDRCGRVSINGNALKSYTGYFWLTIRQSVDAILPGHLRIDMDECIASYSDLMRTNIKKYRNDIYNILLS